MWKNIETAPGALASHNAWLLLTKIIINTVDADDYVGLVLPPLKGAHIMKVASMVWISTALLHKENPEQEDFSNREIIEKARAVDAKDASRPGVWQHICTHCVAAKAPNPGRYRYLHETARGRRRLFREGDPYHPDRNGEPHPNISDIPEEYRYLLDWYDQAFNHKQPKRSMLPPGAPAEKLFMFVGTLTPEDAAHMKRYVEEWCERIDQ